MTSPLEHHATAIQKLNDEHALAMAHMQSRNAELSSDLRASQDEVRRLRRELTDAQATASGLELALDCAKEALADAETELAATQLGDTNEAMRGHVDRDALARCREGVKNAIVALREQDNNITVIRIDLSCGAHPSTVDPRLFSVGLKLSDIICNLHAAAMKDVTELQLEEPEQPCTSPDDETIKVTPSKIQPEEESPTPRGLNDSGCSSVDAECIRQHLSGLEALATTMVYSAPEIWPERFKELQRRLAEFRAAVGIA